MNSTDALLLGTSPPAQPLGPPLTSAANGGLPQTANASPDLTAQSTTSTTSAPSSVVGSGYSQRVILTTYPSHEYPFPSNLISPYLSSQDPKRKCRLHQSLILKANLSKASCFFSLYLLFYLLQVGIKPIPLNWDAKDPQKRGPVVASRHPNSIKIRNSIGAYGGSYSIYRALACAMGQLNPNHRPDYTNTEPPFDIPPNESWYTPGKIVAMDPWGHLAPQLFKKEFDSGVDVRPSIAVTRAHIKMPELDEAVRTGRLTMDGKIVQKSDRLPGTSPDSDPGVEVSVSKAAVEPVWFLPGVAERLGVTEAVLRRALFEDTGGMYPELLTRHDLSVFLPPISGLTVYIFGDPASMSRSDKEVTVRVHDECNGSDVFGSDICTCRPYLIFGIEEAIKTAQRGGSGVVVYFRKEGRALGEVTKYLVYNARKRGTDAASMYFKRTENIAGVKDMRFQALMPDVLHW